MWIMKEHTKTNGLHHDCADECWRGRNFCPRIRTLPAADTRVVCACMVLALAAEREKGARREAWGGGPGPEGGYTWEGGQRKGSLKHLAGEHSSERKRFRLCGSGGCQQGSMLSRLACRCL